VLLKVSGKLVKEDYEQFVPEVEQIIKQHGRIRILLEMHDFHGWSCSAAWEDTKFALHHFRDIQRLAFVGEKKWQKGMATFCKPFTKAEIRYFEHSQADEARAWLTQEPIAVK
jgi:hypothetical protein